MVILNILFTQKQEDLKQRIEESESKPNFDCKLKEPKKRRNRNPEKPGNCRYCGKVFNRRSTAYRHEREVCKDHGAPRHHCYDDCPSYSSDTELSPIKKKRTS